MTYTHNYNIIYLDDFMTKEKFIEENLILKQIPPKKYENPFIIALSGYSGSGKSHIAKVLSQSLGLYIVGGDSVRQKVYQDEELKNLPLEEIQKLTNKVSELKIKKLLENNISIVIDRSLSSLESLKILKSFNCKVLLINIISDHEQNIKRIINRTDDYSLGGYGDVDSKSGVKTKEMYDEIRERKVYDIPLNLFDFTIDAKKDLDNVINQTKEIAIKIKEQLSNNKVK